MKYELSPAQLQTVAEHTKATKYHVTHSYSTMKGTILLGHLLCSRHRVSVIFCITEGTYDCPIFTAEKAQIQRS